MPDMDKPLTDPQRYALKHALWGGIKSHRERKLKRPLRGKDCELNRHYRSPVTGTTIRALKDRGLATGNGWSFYLTAAGVKAARAAYDEEFAEGVRIEDDDAPGIVYVPTTVEEYVEAIEKLDAARKAAWAEQVKTCTSLWTGVKLDTWQGKRAMTTLIREEFTEGYTRGLTFSLEDLIAIGEQVRDA